MGEINMKILVCTDGSEQSKKALNVASVIAERGNFDEVSIIHVLPDKQDLSLVTYNSATYGEQAEEIRKKVIEMQSEEAKKILREAVEVYKNKNINAETILRQGHPAKTILELAAEQGFDIIFIGSRGLGGWKKRILGSVSSAVVQEAKNISVVVVK